MKAAASPFEKPHHPYWPLEGLLFAFVFALGILSVHEPSAWIRVKTGAKILSEGVLPRAEPFSYGAAGTPWTTNSWLTDVAFAKLDALGGPGLVSVLKSAAIAAGFALMLPISQGNPALAAGLLAAGACAAWTGFGETPFAFDFLFFALAVRLLRPRRRFRWADAIAVAGLTILWSNVHGASAPLAPWLVGLKTFKTSLRTAARERLGYWMLLVVCLIVFSWNPHGYGILAHAFADAASGVAAWRSPLASLSGLFILAGAAACWFTLQEEFVTTLAAATVMGLGLALPGLRPLAVLAACPVIALALGHFVSSREDSRPRLLAWCALAAVLLAGYVQAVSRPLAPSGGYGAPSLSGAVKFLNVSGVRGRMFNEPETGAELIGLTDRPVFSDRRQGPYPEAFRRDALDWPRSFGSLDSAYAFDYAVVRNHRASAPAKVLDEDPAWKLAYADDRALVYLKKTGANAWLAPQSPFSLVAPNRLWPDVLDAALSKSGGAARILGELDRWSVAAPDCVQALLWKAYALSRLKMGERADRLLDVADERPALSWDPELQAEAGFVLEARGRDAQARLFYRRALRGARRLDDGALARAVEVRLSPPATPR